MLQTKPLKKLYPLLTLLILVALSVLCAPQDALAKKKHHTAKAQTTANAGSWVTSSRYAALVIDAGTGQVLEATNSDALRHPASLTKMMTLYMAFNAVKNGTLRFDHMLPVSSYAAAQSPSKLGLRAGQNISVRDAVMGLITESANDAAVVLAEAMGGSEGRFARQMTQQARALGMSRSEFRNASGLPNPDQVTTARDMALLGRALLIHFPDYYPLFNTASFTYRGVRHNNHNHLMKRYTGMDGIKTGYIRASGFNLVASAKRDKTRLIGVVFGGPSAVSRDTHMAVLLDRNFERAGQDVNVAKAPPIKPEAKPGMRLARIPPNTSSADSADLAQGDSNETDDTTPMDALSPAPVPEMQTARAPTPSISPVRPETSSTRTQDAAPLRKVAATTGTAVSSLRRAKSPGGWNVQIGAFSNAKLGQTALREARKAFATLTKDAKSQVTHGKGLQRSVWRAQFVGLDERAARSLCDKITQSGKGCLVIKTGGQKN